MGLFDKIKEKFVGSKPEEWYYSTEGKSKLFDLLVKPDGYTYEQARLKFIENYLKTLPNIKEQNELGHYIACDKLAKNLLAMVDHVVINDLGLEVPAPYSRENLLDPKKNPYVRFIKKLNHSYCGSFQDLVDRLIFERDLPLNSEFLYDPSLFDLEYNRNLTLSENDELVCQKIEEYLLKNNILN